MNLKDRIVKILEDAESAECGYTYEEQKKNGHADIFGINGYTWIRMKNKILKAIEEGSDV